MPKLDLSRIQAKREKITEQLAALDAQEQAELDRRAAIAGHAVLAHAQADDAFAATLRGILDTAIRKNTDRALFDLPKRARKPKAK